MRRSWGGAICAVTLAAGLTAPIGAVADERPVDRLEAEIVPSGDGPERQQRGEAAPKAQAAVVSAAGGSKNVLVQRQSYRRAGLPAAQTISRVDVMQESTGRARATVVFAANPTSTLETRVDVQLGVWNGGSCQTQFELRVVTDPAARGGFGSGAGWDNSIAGTAIRSGRTVTAATSATPAIRTATWNCAWVMSGIPVGAGLERAQEFYAEDLAAPKLSVTGGQPVQGAAKGKWLTMRLRVNNTGYGDAWNTVVKPSGSGLSFKPRSRKLGTIADRSTKHGVTFKVKLKGSKARKVTYRVTATGGHQKNKSFRIAQQPKAKKYKSLSGRYFWGHLPASSSAYRGWQNNAVWFVNKKWAYVGFPKGSVRPKCRKASSRCKKYSYNRKSGKVKIGKQSIKITTRGFKFKARAGQPKGTYYPLALPKKKTKLAVDLVHKDWSGYCPITCTASTERITLAKNGRFLRSAFSVGSWPGIGQSWSSAPPDKRGTYRVISKGRIELRYATGTKKRHVIGIELDVRGKPSPAGAGLVMGDTNFYLQD